LIYLHIITLIKFVNIGIFSMNLTDGSDNTTLDQNQPNQPVQSIQSSESNPSSETEDVTDKYDDELDENFEKELDATDEQLEKTINSFENPVGIEKNPDSTVTDGPLIDSAELEKFRKQINNMPKEKLMSLLKNISQKNNCGLGDNNFRSVNDEHRKDARERLRQKLEERRFARKPKDVRDRQLEHHKASMQELKLKNPDVDTDVEKLFERDTESKTSLDLSHTSDYDLTDASSANPESNSKAKKSKRKKGKSEKK